MRWWLVVAVGSMLGCGTSDDDAGGTAVGSGGTGGTGGSGGTSAGTGGTSAAGSSGTTGMSGIDCTGTFGEPVVMFTNQPRLGIGGLTLRADELELIYAEAPYDSLEPRHFRRSVRASKDAPFTTGELVAPLDAACSDSENRSGDLTKDGLRYYFTCYTDFEDAAKPIHLARRASVDAPFVVDATTYGVANTGLSLDTDELTLFSSGPTQGSAPLARQRGTTADPFGTELALTGLDGWVTPTLSSDGRQLYAANNTEADRRSLMIAMRTGPTEFTSPTVLRTFADPVFVSGSPAISADCRTLYYVSVTDEPVYSLMLLRR